MSCWLINEHCNEDWCGGLLWFVVFGYGLFGPRLTGRITGKGASREELDTVLVSQWRNPTAALYVVFLCYGLGLAVLHLSIYVFLTY